MQKRMLHFILWKLRIAVCLLLVALPVAGLFSFRTTRILDNIWQQIGISKEQGSRQMRESFIYGYLQYYGGGKIKNLATGDRTAVATELMTYCKSYIGSAEFLQAYQKLRTDAKPVPDNRKARTKEEVRKEMVDKTEKSIKETEQNLKTMKPDMAKSVAPVLDVLKQQLKDYKDPESQMIEYMYQGELMNVQAEEKSFAERTKRWQEEFPADPNVLIKQRLQHFIALAATVDFNAELKLVGGKKKFVKAAYEGQSTEWKQVFRAGKEVIQPAVAFAKQWLAELK